MGVAMLATERLTCSRPSTGLGNCVKREHGTHAKHVRTDDGVTFGGLSLMTSRAVSAIIRWLLLCG